jgi:hypothetical protein
VAASGPGIGATAKHLSRPAEAWCGDFVTDIYKRAHIPLPPMQPGCRTGFAGCPAAVNYGRRHHATRYSWHAEPADIVLFNRHGEGVPTTPRSSPATRSRRTLQWFLNLEAAGKGHAGSVLLGWHRHHEDCDASWSRSSGSISRYPS